MKFPETADDIESEILISSDKSKELGDLRIRQLIKILPKVNSEIIVEGVIRIFEIGKSVESNSQDQEFAGKVLEDINPTSKKDLKEILQRVLKNWDKSVEQFPFSLRDKRLTSAPKRINNFAIFILFLFSANFSEFLIFRSIVFGSAPLSSNFLPSS